MNQTLRFLQQENARLQVENQRLEEEVCFLNDYLSALSRLDEAAEKITTESDLIPLLDKILYYALTTLDASDGSIALVDEETEELVFVVVHGAVDHELVNYRMPTGEGIIGWVIANRQSDIVNRVKQDSRFSPRVDTLFRFDTKSMVSVPLIIGGRLLGAITVINKHSTSEFSEIDGRLLSLIGRIAAITLARFD